MTFNYGKLAVLKRLMSGSVNTKLVCGVNANESMKFVLK